MKLPDLIYALADVPKLAEEVMAAIDNSYDELYRGMIADGRLQILNFGENLHEQIMSPEYFNRYIIPFYEKRCAQLRGAGIFTHVHIDGYFRNLLPLLKRLPQDGIEALTPKPQGDMTLEEIKEHIGDKVLLDGIPAVLFMESYSREQVMECAEKIVKLFASRLILGISDELPEGCGEEGMARVEMVAKWARTRANKGD